MAMIKFILEVLWDQKKSLLLLTNSTEAFPESGTIQYLYINRVNCN